MLIISIPLFPQFTGIMMSSVEFGGVSVTLILTYLGSKGHKTRWVAAGTLIVTLSCFLRIVPHLIFGPGQDALELTIEYEHMNGSQNRNLSSGKYKLRRYMFNNCKKLHNLTTKVYVKN